MHHMKKQFMIENLYVCIVYTSSMCVLCIACNHIVCQCEQPVDSIPKKKERRKSVPVKFWYYMYYLWLLCILRPISKGKHISYIIQKCNCIDRYFFNKNKKKHWKTWYSELKPICASIQKFVEKKQMMKKIYINNGIFNGFAIDLTSTNVLFLDFSSLVFGKFFSCKSTLNW